MTVEDVALAVGMWLETAVYDLAEGDEIEADNLYNDADTLEDLVGDRVHDLVGGDKTLFIETIKLLRDESRYMKHSAMQEACSSLLRGD